MTETSAKWPYVTRRRPCPVCGKPEWCKLSPDGQVCFCMRVLSDSPRELSNGAVGYVHKMTEPVPAPIRKPTSVPCSMMPLATQYTQGVGDDALRGLAQSLGVSTASLKSLQVGCVRKGVWSFPMKDFKQRIIGIRLRSADGRKWSVRGSRDGLFIPVNARRNGRVYVVEGPTDTAAMLTIGVEVIGRSSCSTGGPLLVPLCAGRDVVVVSDNDEPKTRPDGSVFYPGQDGAKRLAKRLIRHVKSVFLIKPPWNKDMRDWLKSTPHLTPEDLWDLALAKGMYRGT